jgi:ATP-dependent exoDNAse (exonuclease V) alpha subunit
VLLDEAGQVGGRDLAHLLRLVRAADGRLILSGDTQQHGAVAVSDALRAIEQHAGLRPAVVRRIRRQDPARGRDTAERAFIRGYRAAVRAAAQGDLAGSFARLEALGCLRACAEPDRRAALAAEYVAARARGENVLVVAPTRAEVALTNEAIRTQLEAAGLLGPATTLATYTPVDLTAAEKRDPRAYTPGRAVYFLQRYGRYRRGDLCKVVGVTERGVVLMKNQRRATLSFRYAHRFVVAERTDLTLAPGDRLQLKFNGMSREGRPLANGELVTVHRLTRRGEVVVHSDDGRRKTLTATQRLVTRGYAVTSYTSQGKTVDTVLLADAAASAATNAKQWYVTISRARRRVLLFSSDPAALRENIQRLGERPLALDLATPLVPAVRRADWRRRALEGVSQHQRHEAVVTNCRPAPCHRLAL